MFVNGELRGTPGRDIEWASRWPQRPSNAPNRRSKSLPFKFQPTEMSIEHSLGHIGWLWNDAMNNRTAFVKAPNEWMHIERNMCGRRAAQLDHHCGDDLIFAITTKHSVLEFSCAKYAIIFIVVYRPLSMLCTCWKQVKFSDNWPLISNNFSQSVYAGSFDFRSSQSTARSCVLSLSQKTVSRNNQ